MIFTLLKVYSIEGKLCTTLKFVKYKHKLSKFCYSFNVNPNGSFYTHQNNNQAHSKQWTTFASQMIQNFLFTVL